MQPNVEIPGFEPGTFALQKRCATVAPYPRDNHSTPGFPSPLVESNHL